MPRRLLLPLLAALAAAALLPSAARAAGTPDITASVSSDSALLGAPVHVTVSAANPSGPYAYNLSFRVVLPAGVAYAGGAPSAPTSVANQPAAGQTTLLFTNLSDLSPGSSYDLGFDVTPSTASYDAGDSFAVQGSAFVNTDARYVPKFTATGAPNGPSSTSYTGYAGPLTGTQTLSAIEVQKSEPSPEGEILRGVHDHQTVYTLTVRDNGVNPTTGTTLDDYLPAGLEFLGCGAGTTDDHTTDAPTNPGSPQESPGAGAIDVPTLAGCTEPDTVDTVNVDPDGPAGPMTAGVYTHVTWSLGTLAPSAVQTIRYRAAVPMRANALAFTGTRPSAASGNQATNLDNNSGPLTADEGPLRNYAIAAGTYQGATPTATSDATILDRTAEDWAVQKSVSDPALAEGSIRTWTLHFEASEYKPADDITVTDTLPSGLCPLAATNLTSGNDGDDSECDPAGGQLPSAPYTSAAEQADGTWRITWDSSTAPELGHVDPNGEITLSFPSRTRSHYQANFLPTTPILTRDTLRNDVSTQADAAGTTVTDVSSASVTAAAPTIDKRVAASGTDCLTASYVDTVPHYHPGDRVCWRLRVDFPGVVDTAPQAIQDFLPPGTAYSPSIQATGSDNVSATADESNASSGVLSWTVNGATVPAQSKVFERVFSTTVAPLGTVVDGDLTGNLMKFSSTNTAGVSEPLRDEASYVVDAPEIALKKGVAQVDRGGSTVIGPNGANVDNVAVQDGDRVTYRIDVTNSGSQDAQDVQVRDALPSGYDCPLAANPDGGVCTDGGVGTDRIDWTIPTVAAGTTTTLTYSVFVPADLGPARSLANTATVLQYAGDTNLGTQFIYTPGGNAAPATDGSEVHTADATITKQGATDLTESGNSATQATIGEGITYTITAKIPAGTTLHGVAQLTDTVDSSTRQPYIVGSAGATLNGGALPGGFSLDTSGATPKLVFPSDYANAAGSGDDIVVLTFRTQVADVGTNTRTAATLTDRGSLTWADPAAGAQTRNSNVVSTSVVEPLISQTKTDDRNPARVAPGDVVTYTVRTANSNATRVSAAHDVLVTDHVPTGLTPVGAAPGNLPLADGATVPGSGGAVWHAGTRTITYTAATINAGGNATFSYRAQVDDPATGGATLTNSVDAAATSMAGTPTGERTAGTGYAASTSDIIRLGAATITKSVSVPDATVGDPVAYTLHVTIPAHLALYDVTVVDTLPDSVDFDSYGAVTCVSGCPLVNAARTYAPAAGAANTVRLAWDLGDIGSPLATAQVVDLVVNGHVRATHRGGATPVSAGQTAVNQATVASNTSDSGDPFDPSAIPTGLDDTSAPAPATTTVREPSVHVDKQVKVGGGAFGDGPATAGAGSTLTYRLQIKNSGDAPAYDVAVTDQPDAELENVLAAGQPGVTLTDGWTAGDPALAWHLDGPIAPGDTVTLSYTADLVAAAGLHDDEHVDNTAGVPHYFGVPAATRSANPGYSYRDYTDGGTDAAQVVLDFPTFTTVKTTGGPGFPDTAEAEIGQDFPWRVVVTNTSDTAAATDVVVTDTLPANWSYVTGSATLSPGGSVEPADPASDQLEWTIPSLAAGASVTVTYDARPSVAARTTPGLGAGANVNSARVSAAKDAAGNPGTADGAYGSPADSATATLLAPTLQLTKTPDHGPATAGTASSFSLQVHNAGTGTARAVDVVDTLPAGLAYTAGTATASPSAGFSESPVTPGPGAGETTVHLRLASLAAGATTAITLPVAVGASVADGTTLTNHASVTATEDPTGDSDPGSLDVTAAPDVSVDKTGAATYTPGEDYTWHLRVRNTGPSDATAVTLTDPLPGGTAFRSADAPCTNAGGTVSCTLGTLAPGFDHTYDVTVAVDPGNLTSPLDNTATVAAPHDSDGTNDSDTFGPDSAAVADLSVTKSVASADILKNHTTTFTLAVHNGGPSVARDVSLVDTLPAGLRFESADDPGCAEAGGVVTCDLADMAPGADAVVHVVVTGTANGTWTNQAQVSSSTPEPPDGGDPNAATADVAVSPVAELALAKTAAATVAAGGTVTWTLAVTNHGPDDATGVEISDPLPAGTVYAGADAGCAQEAGTVTCAIGDLADGATATRQVSAVAPIALASTSLLNVAAVVGDQGDDDPTNDTAQATTTVGPSADLALIKHGPATVAANGTVAWTIVATNHGPSAATGVVVEDTLPAGVDLLGAKPTQGACAPASGVLRCTLGALAKDGSASIQVLAHVPPALQGTTVRNRAVIHGTEPDPVGSNDAASAATRVGAPELGDYDVRLTKALVPGAAPEIGGRLTYELRVSNSGPATATGVTVVDPLPSGLRFVSAAAPDGTCAAQHGVITCALGSLDAGGNRTITVVAQALRAGSVRNTATVTAAVADAAPSNDVAGATAPIAMPRAKLALTKRASRHRARPGGLVHYAITVRNVSTHAAADVKVCDRLPGALVYVRTKGARFRHGDACWSVGLLPSHASKKFKVLTRITRSARKAKVRNVAVASARNATRRRAAATVRLKLSGVLRTRAGTGVTG